MNIAPDVIARALIDTCSTLKREEFPAAVDAAIAVLEEQGMAKAIRTFPRTVRSVLEKTYGVLYVDLAVPADASDAKQDILLVLTESLGKNIELTVTTDPSLIGGARLRVGDERIDASVRGAIEGLKKQLVSSSLSPSLV